MNRGPILKGHDLHSVLLHVQEEYRIYKIRQGILEKKHKSVTVFSSVIYVIRLM